MTADPESNGSGATPPLLDESARPPILSAVSGPPISVVPGRDAAALSKVQEVRDFTAREMAAIARRRAEIQSELQRVEARLDGVNLLGPEREKLRKLRNGLRERLEVLNEALEDGQRRL